MARIKFGSIVTEGAGSLGGHTFQNSKGGAQLRSKPINKRQPSAAQSLIRSYNPQLQGGWRSLSNAQRAIWSRFAVSHQVSNKKGDPHPLSGHSLYLKYNFEYISRGLPLIETPFEMGPPYLGPELLINGDFDSSTGWSFGAEWVVSGGQANYLATGAGDIRQGVDLVTNVSYRLVIVIASTTGACNIRFFNSGFTNLFKAPYGGTQMLSVGVYTIDGVVDLSTNVFRLYSLATSDPFSVEQLSLKRIYE
jgi:hypothetical protein